MQATIKVGYCAARNVAFLVNLFVGCNATIDMTGYSQVTGSVNLKIVCAAGWLSIKANRLAKYSTRHVLPMSIETWIPVDVSRPTIYADGSTNEPLPIVCKNTADWNKAHDTK
jgi:hypothetical protein